MQTHGRRRLGVVKLGGLQFLAFVLAAWPSRWRIVDDSLVLVTVWPGKGGEK